MKTRCPCCGFLRPENAFLNAGSHRLEVETLRGLGHGRGFLRTLYAVDLNILTLLSDALDRAKAHVTHLIAQASAPPPHVGPLPWPAPAPPQPALGPPMPPQCPNCGQALSYHPSGRWICNCGLVL